MTLIPPFLSCYTHGLGTELLDNVTIGLDSLLSYVSESQAVLSAFNGR